MMSTSKNFYIPHQTQDKSPGGSCECPRSAQILPDSKPSEEPNTAEHGFTSYPFNDRVGRATGSRPAARSTRSPSCRRNNSCSSQHVVDVPRAPRWLLVSFYQARSTPFGSLYHIKIHLFKTYCYSANCLHPGPLKPVIQPSECVQRNESTDKTINKCDDAPTPAN